MKRRLWGVAARAELFIGGLVLVMSAAVSSAAVGGEPALIDIDARAADQPFPHFWEQAFGSGRAILSLRESYRNDLRDLKRVADFRYVRFHAIFHDEVGVYDEEEDGTPRYNFTYVDQIYDGLLANGVRPIVEIGFMPRKLALRQDVHPFWYRQVVAPPKNYGSWDALIHAFASHLLERYGEAELAQWYFEVWNEPNIDFWSGEPKQASYFELYDHTARALKAVSPVLRVGGPATAAADWVPEFIAHTVAEAVPVDFVSTHGYADDTVEDLFHDSRPVPFDQRLCRAVGKVHGQILASARPALPLLWTEWNVASFGDEYRARDTTYVGAALADDIRQCDGLVDMLSYWTFDDVFEEGGVRREPFDGGFGTIALGGIRKPSYYAYGLLHRLGDRRLANASSDVLVTRRADGTLLVGAWNVVDPDRSGAARSFAFRFKNLAAAARVTIRRVDDMHGNVLPHYRSIGAPRYPTPAQVRDLNRTSEPGAPQIVRLRQGRLDVTVPVNGLVLLEVAVR